MRAIDKLLDLASAGHTEENDIARRDKFCQRGGFSGAPAEKIFERRPVAMHERLQGISVVEQIGSDPVAHHTQTNKAEVLFHTLSPSAAEVKPGSI